METLTVAEMEEQKEKVTEVNPRDSSYGMSTVRTDNA